MSDYETDILIWSEDQADLLRRVAAGEGRRRMIGVARLLLDGV